MPASAAWTRPEDLVENLSSVDSGARLKALRDVKNQIIGNKTKKLSYIKLGAVPRVVEILANETEIPLLVQSAAAVGSFACGVDAGVRAVLEHGVMPHLLKTLSNTDEKVVEAGVRSLKMIFQSAMAPRGDMCQGPTLATLLSLLRNSNDSVAEVAASVVARCCETPEQQMAIVSAGALDSLAALLGRSVKKSEAALDAIAALARTNERVCSVLMAHDAGRTLDTVARFTKDKMPRTRLLACSCIVNLGYRFNNPLSAAVAEARNNILLTLLPLLEEPGEVSEEAARILSLVLRDQPQLHLAAFEAHALQRLMDSLAWPRTGAAAAAVVPFPATARHMEHVLSAIAELCSRLECCRFQALSLCGVEPFVRAMYHESLRVQQAACQCLHSLSRSIKNLRTDLASAMVRAPLINLLGSPSKAVQAAALATVCNAVLGSPPAMSDDFPSAAVPHLCQLASSADMVLRRDSARALSNLLFLAKSEKKAATLATLTHATLIKLLNDHDVSVQAEALELCRNIVHGVSEDIDLFLGKRAEEMLAPLFRQLSAPCGSSVTLQALHVLSNIACGRDAHKQLLLNMKLPAAISRLLADVAWPSIRVACVWCVINLATPAVSQPDDAKGAGAADCARNQEERIEAMRDAGVENRLLEMKDDPCTDLTLRVDQALYHFMTTEEQETRRRIEHQHSLHLQRSQRIQQQLHHLHAIADMAQRASRVASQ